MLQRTKPDWKITANIIGDERGAFLKDAELGLGATPDAFILDEDGRPGVAQIKSVEPSIFRREWMQDGDEPVPPLWIAAQVILEAYLARAKFAVVVPVRVGHRIDIDVINVPLHEEVIERILRETREFWARIAALNPPQPDYRRDGELLARMLGPDDGTSISLAHDNEFVDAIGMRESLKQRLKETQEDLGYYETLIKDRIGPHSAATTADHVVTLKTQHRKSYTVAANSFRVMRVKSIGGR
jgi:hypothetical protein